jgi:hypothetical protein
MTAMPMAGTDSIDSSLYALSSAREKVLEHLFVGELLKCLWKRGRRDIEVLRAEVDMGGYDIAIEAYGVLRHIQLKSSYASARTARVPINMNLARKPSGCIVWMRFDPDTLVLGPYHWLGAAPGVPLPDIKDEKIGRHTKANKHGVKAERPNIRILPKKRFEEFKTIESVVDMLFGADSTSSPRSRPR